MFLIYLVIFCISQIFWTNSSNQEEKSPGRVKPKSTTLIFQTTRANTARRREFHSWKHKESALPRRTPRRQSRVKTSRLTLQKIDTTIITHNTQRMSAKITCNLKPAMQSLQILKESSRERAQVSLCHIKHQERLCRTCLYLYRLILQLQRRRATVLWKKDPSLHSYQQLTVCLHSFMQKSQRAHYMLLTNCYYSDDAAEREPPRPKPRQRTLGLSATEKIDEDAESQDLSRPQTSSASIPVSFDRSSNVTVRSCSPNMCFNARLFCFF